MVMTMRAAAKTGKRPKRILRRVRMVVPVAAASAAPRASVRRPHLWDPGDHPRFSQSENGVHGGVSPLWNQGTAVLAMKRTTRVSVQMSAACEGRTGWTASVFVFHAGSSNRSTVRFPMGCRSHIHVLSILPSAPIAAGRAPLRSDCIKIPLEKLVVDRGPPEHGHRGLRADEPMSAQGRRLSDRGAVAHDDVRLTLVESAHDLSAVVAKLALIDLLHSTHRSTRCYAFECRWAPPIGTAPIGTVPIGIVPISWTTELHVAQAPSTLGPVVRTVSCRWGFSVRPGHGW